jgi:hypothetical protein
MSKRVKKSEVIQFNHAAEVPVVGTDQSILSGLLAEMVEGAEGAEVVEHAEVTGEFEAPAADAEVIESSIDAVIESAIESAAAPVEHHDEALVESAVEAAERRDATEALYAKQSEESEEIVGDGEPPATTQEAIEDPAAAKEAAKAAKKAEAAKKKAEREAAKAAKKAEPKPVRPTSITHKPGALMVAKLGEKWRDIVVFDVTASEHTEAQDAFVERMNDPKAIADKVRDKAIMLLSWIKTGGELNKVMDITFRTLHKDGHLASGEKGNLHLALLAKPFTKGTANSQSNQMFMLLPELKVTVKEKGRMVPNPNSALLPAIYAHLGLA